ncbi:MAG: hypothetical protein A2234_01255 [Elusimicrobia bacterium RIFOXYA2_FULL_58_8]|nr:MAG: hypothetical protein A2285_09125 [Elusimicrobia bacterium RIFOXYA12_FULL_57_11]OGS16957.1 MAG: hypothetical protein A2234_01255 [Elusimicrobia bacterium RIFOXYA2_FULL_58_8]
MKHGKTRTYRACLPAMVFLAAVPCVADAQVSAGGEYVIESSVVDNGGGDWLTGGQYASRGSIGQTLGTETPVRGGHFINRSGFYNPPYFTYQKGLPSTLSLYSGEVSLSMPPDAVTDREMFDIGINRQSLNQPLLVEMSKVEAANRKMSANEGPWAQFSDNDLTEMYIFDEHTLTRDPLKKTGVLSLRYRDADSDGIIDFSNPPVKVDTVDAWVLDEKTRLWTLLPNMGLNKDNKTITVSFQGPGVYNMIGAMATGVDKVYSYPTPFRPNGPNKGGKLDGPGRTGTEAEGITFQDVTAQTGNISIYTLNGQLIRKLDLAAPRADLNSVVWNVKNDSGSRVASGVYLWRVTSGSNSKTGKVMIIW